MPEFTKVYKVQGFDHESTPKWQMVPVAGERYVILKDGAGLTVKSASPWAAAVTEVKPSDLPPGEMVGHAGPHDRLFMIRGVSHADTKITAHDGAGVLKATLDVGVKLLRPVKVTFSFLRDSAGHATRRAPSMVPLYLHYINGILTPQANVIVEPKWIRFADFPGDLGDIVWSPPCIVPLSLLRDAGAEVDLFFVWKFDHLIYRGVPGENFGTFCVVEDVPGWPDSITMAHEIAHSLHLDDRLGPAHHFAAGGKGIHITRADADRMNP